jgi:hypothetical protein
MYGLVNQAIHDMVCDRFGEETWQAIRLHAEIDVDNFLSMEAYLDDLTHRLVKAASAVLGLSAAEIMQAFGEFWVEYTGKNGYGEMMDMGGDNLPEFLQNLDELHARVGVSFPQLQPPSFDCSEIEADSLTLHYNSSREGLAPMIFGLVKGLGTKFNTEVNVTQTQSRQEGDESDTFLIQYKPN